MVQRLIRGGHGCVVFDAQQHDLSPRLQAGDVVVDGGHSRYVDDLRRAKLLEARGVHDLDAGVSGGVWGIERGYCLMIGGDSAATARLDPIFKSEAVRLKWRRTDRG